SLSHINHCECVRTLLITWTVFILFSAFFFFQAEDGIRDGHVTGVQTCALPILGPVSMNSPKNKIRNRSHGLSLLKAIPTTTKRVSVIVRTHVNIVWLKTEGGRL